MPIISGLTFTVTDSTIVAVWTTDVSADSNLTAGSKAAIDNGVAASGTSHQCIVAGLKPSTLYSCFVTSGGTSSTPQNITTNALQTRIRVTSGANSTYTAGSNSNNQSDTQRTFLSSDNKVYVTQDDATGIVLGTPNAGFATQIAALSNETNMTGGATLLTNYGVSNEMDGTDGPGGIALTNKSSGVFGLNGNLHMFVYRQNAATGDGYYGNWIKSTNHGATWNNFTAPSTFVAGGVQVSPHSPAQPVMFYANTIGLVTPVLYAADDGTLGYNTAGNQIDGGNAYVYMTYIPATAAHVLYLMRLPRIQFDNQNAAPMQYWAGGAYPTPLDFVNDSNWSSSSGLAVNIRPTTPGLLPSGIWNQVAFVPAINSYVMSFNNSYDGSNRNLWVEYSAPTPAGPWQVFFTRPTSNPNYNGFFIFHRDVAANVATSNIGAKFLQSTTPGGGPNYNINYSTLTMLPSSGAQMVQVASYNFATVENPLSNGGTFSIPPGWPVTALKVPSAGICEGTVGGGAGNGAYYPLLNGNAWPADHYCEITVGTATSTSDHYIIGVRQDGPTNTRYQLVVTGTTGSPASAGQTLFALVNGAAVGPNPLKSFNMTIAPGDIIRLSVSGSVLTTTQNGLVIDTTTDAGSFVAGPGAPSIACIPGTAITSPTMVAFAAGANQAVAPTFSPATGTLPLTVTITGPVGSTIYYTTNGSTPTRSSSSIASGGTIFATSSPVQAIASVTNFADSQVSGVSYLSTGGGSGSFTQRQHNFANKR